ncbi:MAG: radical SAM protein [Deltaproteobacteria bacterium]|nr:radical SAM protein [Deltaproteobacteria bacterium]
MNEKDLENAKREKLRREKPGVYEKVMKIADRHARGVATPIIDIGYNYSCNMNCRHCCASRFEKKNRRLAPDDLQNLSNQAHDLGLCQFCISGGEPLLFKDLDDVLLALQPEKFHLTMSTNAYFMTKEKAKHLKQLGLDKVKISVDDFDSARHDENRGKLGAYSRAIEGLENARDAGLNVVIQTVVTRQNCKSEGTIAMAEFAKKNGYIFDVMVVRAIGELEGNYDVLINEEDSAFLLELHEKYPNMHRDTFPAYGMSKGCSCVNSTLHLTQFGDILPCAYIHISIGDFFSESLEDIISRGQRIRHFRKYSKLCLSGEDRAFIQKYMSKFYGKPLPIPWWEAFEKDDFEE